MEKLKSGSIQMSQIIDFLGREFLECIEMAEKNKDIALVIKSNCSQQKSIKIKSDLKLLDKEDENIKKEKKKLSWY